MRTTDRKTTNKDRAEILTDLMRKMWRSGYGHRYRENVLESGLKGYLRMVEVELEGGRRLNRCQEEGKGEREIKKVIGKASWHLKTGKAKNGGGR